MDRSGQRTARQASFRSRGVNVIVASLTLMAPVPALAQSAEPLQPAFEYQQRSTIDTVPFRSIEEAALSDTAIEGGLAAPAEGIPVQAGQDDDFYLDPLALQPRDDRTDLGRSEIPVDIRFSNPKVIPGQTHGNNYVIRPPENRTYDTFNINMTER